jgi:ribonuclease P protein component
VLPRNARLTSPNDFARTTKSGYRLASKSLVLYLYPTTEISPARFGLIIGKSIGGSVIRHRLARQIRHLLRDQTPIIPSGSLVVIRALPNLQKLSSHEISQELVGLIVKMLQKNQVTR